MVTLNFCTACGGKKVQDVKQELEKLVTQKDFSSDICNICCEPIPPGSHQPATSEEQSLHNFGPGVKAEGLQTKLSDVSDEEDDVGNDDNWEGSSLIDDDVAMTTEEDASDGNGEESSIENETGDKLQVKTVDRVKTNVMKSKPDLKYTNRIVDDAHFRLKALRPELSKIAGVVNDEKYPFRCKLCKKTKKYKACNNLVSHLASHLDNKEISRKPYQCNKCCDVLFKNIRQWTKHVKVYQCRDPTCRRRFQCRLTFAAHEKNHNQSDLRLFKCSQCNKGFLTSSALSCHLRTHGKVHQSQISNADILDEDVKTELQGTPEQVNAKEFALSALRPEIAKMAAVVVDQKLPYQCRQCETENQFGCIQDLVDHLSSHSSEDEIFKEPYQCRSSCKACFQTLTTWSDHTCQHTSSGMIFDNKKSTKSLRDDGNHNQNKPFKCSECCKSFANQDNLLGHMRKSHQAHEESPARKEEQGVEPAKKHRNETESPEDVQSAAYQAMKEEEEDVRIQKSSVRPELKQLLKDDDDTGTMFMCTQCTTCAPFETFSSFMTHAAAHVSKDILDEAYQCNECCQEKFKYFSDWRTHVKPHKCVMLNCTFRGPTRFKARQHFTQVHSNAERKFKCDQCPKAFHRKYDLKIHVKAVHEKVKRFTCSTCGLQFFRQTNLVIHERTHSSVKPVQCDICGVRFCSKQGLSRHMMDHTGEKPFVCEQCGFATKTKKDLRAHQQRHLTKRAYECDICGMQISKPSLLERHKRTHTGEKIYKCRYCNEYFMYRETRNSHERHHSECIDPVKHICTVCGKSFETNSRLQNHVVVHSEDKPLQCLKCSFRTKHKASLHEHQKIHERKNAAKTSTEHHAGDITITKVVSRYEEPCKERLPKTDWVLINL